MDAEAAQDKETTTMTTMTRNQIKTLRTEAGAAGDLEMVEICDLALSGNEEAIDVCLEAIDEAEMAAIEAEMAGAE